MKISTYDALLKQRRKYPKAVAFIEKLKENGVSLSSIDVNDWNNSPNTIVYVSIPYGKKNGGFSKVFKNRFGPTSLKSALKLYGK